jgi:hypothetical protein
MRSEGMRERAEAAALYSARSGKSDGVPEGEWLEESPL